MSTILQSPFRRIQWLLLLATGPLCPHLQAQDVNEKWNVRYDGTTDGVHWGRAIAMDADGNVVVAGASTGSNGYDFYTVKYAAATGAILWSDRYDGTGDDDDIPYAIAIDAAGDVIVTGSSAGTGSGQDVYTRKYNGATGADLWNERDDGPADGDDAATAVALDSANNVIVAGHTTGSGSGLDFYTAKYTAASGSRLWFRRYNGPGNSDDGATGVAVDAAGNVVVTGFSEGSSSRDFYTAKYDGATDAVLWDERYDGPGRGADEAAAVALDASGNVIVTGTSSNNGNLDIYTIKYAAADGAELWSERYNGPGDAADAGTAVAVDPQGNVIVTGFSVGSNDSRDFYTACYNGRTGVRLWFERFDGPGNREELPAVRGLALGPQNSVAIAGATQMTSGPLAEYDMISILYTAVVTDADRDGLPDSWEVIFWGTTIGHGPADDSDLDGVVELLEYGLGMEPTWPDAWRVPSPVIEGDFLTITLTKRPGVTLGAETSGTLLVGSWSAATTAVVSETAGTIKIRDTVPVSAGGSRFLRTRVTAP